MKILIIAKSDLKGGASIAAYRLFKALGSIKDLDVRFLVQIKRSEDSNVIETGTNKYIQKFRFAWEKLVFQFHQKSSDVRFKFSIANTGEDITANPFFKDADLIHLHWFNNGFLSLRSFEKIVLSGKPIVWTLHDMWAFTGGCFYSGKCKGYMFKCGNCPFLKKPNKNDLSHKVFQKKKNIYMKNVNIQIVTCSTWLRIEALNSSLMSNLSVKVLPNTIDTHVFKPIWGDVLPQSFKADKKKTYILFGAVNISDERKGLTLLLDALKKLSQNSDIIQEKIELLVFGKIKEDVFSDIPFKTHFLSYITSIGEIVALYNISSCFVLPSLEDNLPNTVMEALSCGTPVVAFNAGGIPDMVDHKENGYLAEQYSTEDLMNGIKWVMNHKDKQQLRMFAREKIKKQFNPKLIALQHRDLYFSLFK